MSGQLGNGTGTQEWGWCQQHGQWSRIDGGAGCPYCTPYQLQPQLSQWLTVSRWEFEALANRVAALEAVQRAPTLSDVLRAECERIPSTPTHNSDDIDSECDGYNGGLGCTCVCADRDEEYGGGA